MFATDVVNMFGRSCSHETGAAAFALRLSRKWRVRCSRAPNLTANPSLTDNHLEQLVDRRARRQREHVKPLDPVIARVLELLHGHARARSHCR